MPNLAPPASPDFQVALAYLKAFAIQELSAAKKDPIRLDTAFAHLCKAEGLSGGFVSTIRLFGMTASNDISSICARILNSDLTDYKSVDKFLRSINDKLDKECATEFAKHGTYFGLASKAIKTQAFSDL